MNVYGHLFQGAQAKLTNDLDGLVNRTRQEPARDQGRDDQTSTE